MGVGSLELGHGFARPAVPAAATENFLALEDHSLDDPWWDDLVDGIEKPIVNHGYIKGKHETCPECGETNEVYSRIVGYLRPVRTWNDGKQQEFKDRTPYTAIG